MKIEQTERGFNYVKFKDSNGVECSLQESSRAFTPSIWLGCNNADTKTLIPGKGWTLVDLPEMTISNTRMHLTQEDVQKLLPILQKFAETGEL
jgi:hypothetical protein